MVNDRTSPQNQVGQVSTPEDASVSDGVTRRDVLALLAAFGVPSAALAQDPVKIMPKNYRVAFENDMVRVLEYINRPGMGPCGTGLHYHPRHVDIFLTDFRSRLTLDGNARMGQVKAGDVKWYEAETHEVENIDKSASRMFMVEIKDANWKPSTG
jgi:beta-alanine degradation protein BauB